MLDRGGKPYRWVTRMRGATFAAEALQSGSHRRLYVVSPVRQEQKALGLSGRQRRRVRAMKDEATTRQQFRKRLASPTGGTS